MSRLIIYQANKKKKKKKIQFDLSRTLLTLDMFFFSPFVKLNLRLKALKRQMEEAEEEIDRLEHSKKKLQRDFDEQQEANEQLQSQLKALRSELR